MILKSVASYSYAETIISDLLNTRSGQGQGQGQDDRVKSIFGATIVSLRPVVVDVGIFMMSSDMISQQSQYELPQSRHVFLAVYMSGLEDTQILADPSSILSINNSKLGIKHFRLSCRDAAGIDRI